MALRNVVVEGDNILRKKCREIEKFDEKLAMLLDDMIETMRNSDGVGIAAPQVGMLKRAVIVEPAPGFLTEMVNPEIISAEGEQEGYEGCLSLPGYIGLVTRPEKVRVRFQNRNGGLEEETYEGFDAVVVSHELDHLEGILYKDKARDYRMAEEA